MWWLGMSQNSRSAKHLGPPCAAQEALTAPALFSSPCPEPPKLLHPQVYLKRGFASFPLFLAGNVPENASQLFAEL